MAATNELHVNGARRAIEVDPERSLLSVLRDDLDLTGCKYGCGEGKCGACTVLIDGKPTRSCITAVGDCDAKQITTIEGLERDGKLHPLILYDANVPGELEKTEEFGAETLKLCAEVGGVLTGEHGVGVEKRDLMPVMFSEIDLNQQQRVKCAFDAKGLLNPGKVFPQLHRCAELARLHVHAGRLPFPDIPRF